MKLIDYLGNHGSEKAFSEKRLAHFRDNAFMCEIHQVDLIVEDGFHLIYCDITFHYEPSHLKLFPNAVWCYDSLEKPIGFQSEPAKIVYCPCCESGRRDALKSMEPSKRLKGKKSKKHFESQ